MAKYYELLRGLTISLLINAHPLSLAWNSSSMSIALVKISVLFLGRVTFLADMVRDARMRPLVVTVTSRGP